MLMALLSRFEMCRSKLNLSALMVDMSAEVERPKELTNSCVETVTIDNGGFISQWLMESASFPLLLALVLSLLLELRFDQHL